MAPKPDLPGPSNVGVDLSGEDLMLLCAGLRAYLEQFAAHRALDGGASHPPKEWAAMRRRVGELIWKLEVAGAPPGARIIHSDRPSIHWSERSGGLLLTARCS